MANFLSRGNFLVPGYKVLFVPGLLTGRKSAPANVPSFADPRGLLRPGMLPANSLGYRIVTTHSEFARSDVPTLLTDFTLGLALFSGLGEVVFTRTRIQVAITLFQGRDVIDLPTDGMERDGDALLVPNNVFLPLHAGQDKFLKKGDDIGAKAALERFFPGKGNLLVGTRLSQGAPKDVVDASKRERRSFVDATSNRIMVSDDPAFISYVAADKLVFRDVLTITSSTQSMGVAGPQVGFLISEVSPSASSVQILRYAPVELMMDETPVVRWRLAESFGVDPGDVRETPDSLRQSLSKDDAAKDDLAAQNKHFVYDLNDDSEDVSDGFAGKPMKTGVRLGLAKAMLDPNSEFFDDNFKAVTIDFKLGLGAGGTLVTPLSANSDSTRTDEVLTTLEYTSPEYGLDLDKDFRLGWEYSTQKSFSLGRVREAIVLAKSREAAVGISAAYDCCQLLTFLFDTVSSPGLSGVPSLVERMFDDVSWKRTLRPLPKPKSPADVFLMGEFPFRSQGRAILKPKSSAIKGAIGDDGRISLPAGIIVTSARMSIPAPNKDTELGAVATFFSGRATDPSLEVGLTPLASATSEREPSIVVGTPPMQPTRFSSDDISLKEVIGVKDQAEVLPAQSGDKSNDPSEFQVSQTGQLLFPVEARNISSCADCSSGHVFLAYEHGNRIDLALRTSSSNNFTILRDVVLRIQDDLDADQEPSINDLPSASLPFLSCDSGSGDIFLFYVYKSRLLVKRVPLEIFSEGNKLDAEWKTVKKMHKLGASMVFDGSGTGDAKGIEADIKAGSIRATGTSQNSQGNRISQYSVCMDSSGYLYVFIQADNELVVRRSGDMGLLWADVLPGEFSLVRPKVKEAGQGESKLENGEAHSCLYDGASNSIGIFFIVENALLFMKWPSEVLRGTSADVANIVQKIRPRLIAGELSKSLLDKDIVPGSNDDEIKGLNIPPHRVAAVVTTEGHYRVWFKDQKQRTMSLISVNSGITWFSERQFLSRSSA